MEKGHQGWAKARSLYSMYWLVPRDKTLSLRGISPYIEGADNRLILGSPYVSK